jgi:tRNA(Ile)-lysidine synthase
LLRGAGVSRTLAQALRDFEPILPLGVAYSGGADSTALLLACAEKWPGQVTAFHVHHGLQSAADAFEQHCHDFCTRLGVVLRVSHVDARPQPGQSPEDAARRARYEALRALALDDPQQPQIKTIAIAQHADDQVETLLLALSRGAGLPGLSAMPAHWVRDGIAYHRPLLDVPGAELRNWLQERGVDWVTDPSNADEQYTRNRIRARLLPALQEAFPQFRDTFARSAAHAAQAQELLLELATQDLALTGQPPVLAKLHGLSRARQANALRHWLKAGHQTAPSAAQLDELLDQIAACTTRAHQIRIKVGSGFVERKGAVLTWYNP